MQNDEQLLQEQLAEQGHAMYKDFMIRTILMLDRMKERFGAEVYAVVEEMVADRTLMAWRQIAGQEENHSIDDLIRILWEPLKNQGFEYSFERREDGIQIYCSKCPLYELAQEINGQEWMTYLNCGTDPHIARGFNPEIQFKRTKTLIQGDDCCDHFYGYPLRDL